MDYISIILTALKLVSSFMDWVKGRQDFKAGVDSQIAAASLDILEKTKTGKALLAKLNAMSDAEVDDILKDLGSK